ncbi:hypothetical protein DOTSEDRAFT_39593 [Dothistroma septosporum NZE10]|uniref:Uncharacterized protein n=1 Tax=Dothistroma septosporum (strain NZE10 / CBS 128990) TaxID=675120 RepID=M2XG50_DOTSN|nr:hypothetical protein DOTSEDRAFT_39593 [Dothistroma septosporum NZE10]
MLSILPEVAAPVAQQMFGRKNCRHVSGTKAAAERIFSRRKVMQSTKHRWFQGAGHWYSQAGLEESTCAATMGVSLPSTMCYTYWTYRAMVAIDWNIAVSTVPSSDLLGSSIAALFQHPFTHMSLDCFPQSGHLLRDLVVVYEESRVSSNLRWSLLAGSVSAEPYCSVSTLLFFRGLSARTSHPVVGVDLDIRWTSPTGHVFVDASRWPFIIGTATNTSSSPEGSSSPSPKLLPKPFISGISLSGFMAAILLGDHICRLAFGITSSVADARSRGTHCGSDHRRPGQCENHVRMAAANMYGDFDACLDKLGLTKEQFHRSVAVQFEAMKKAIPETAPSWISVEVVGTNGATAVPSCTGSEAYTWQTPVKEKINVSDPSVMKGALARCMVREVQADPNPCLGIIEKSPYKPDVHTDVPTHEILAAKGGIETACDALVASYSLDETVESWQESRVTVDDPGLHTAVYVTTLSNLDTAPTFALNAELRDAIEVYTH